jgi:hypothetical protein
MLMETAHSAQLIITSKKSRMEMKFAASETKFGMKIFRIALVLMDRWIKVLDAQAIAQLESTCTESASMASTSAAPLVHTLTTVPVRCAADAMTKMAPLECTLIQKEVVTHVVRLVKLHSKIRQIRRILPAATQITTFTRVLDAGARIILAPEVNATAIAILDSTFLIFGILILKMM